MPLSSLEHLIKNATINENNVVGTDFNDPAAATSNDYIHSEASIDDCLSQSPLNLTRSQGPLEFCLPIYVRVRLAQTITFIDNCYVIVGSSEGGNKSDDDDEYDDLEEKNGFGNIFNGNESFLNGHNLLSTEVPFPWNVSSSNNNKQKPHADDKIAPPPQLLLTSGQLTTGCLQAAQLLIPTAQGKTKKKKQPINRRLNVPIFVMYL